MKAYTSLLSLILCLVFLSACEIGSDSEMTEKELLQPCHSSTSSKPLAKEGEENIERQQGMIRLLVEKRGGVWRIELESKLEEDVENFPEFSYVEAYSQTQKYEVDGLMEDNEGNWIIELGVPSTNINMTYTVRYECGDGTMSEAALVQLASPDICTIKEEFYPRVITHNTSAGNLSSTQTNVELTFYIHPSSTFQNMAFIPYSHISSTAYTSSGGYSFTYNNFIDAFLQKSGQEISPYFNQIQLNEIDLHELTGISKEEWETWEETVIIEGEISLCGAPWDMQTGTEATRFTICFWNP